MTSNSKNSLPETKKFDEDLGVIKLSGKIPKLTSTKYGIFFVDGNSEPESFQQRSRENREALKQLFTGKIDFVASQQKQAPSLKIQYPEDSYGIKPATRQETNGIVRQEEIVTFISKNPETGEIVYLARSRPEMPGTNTPGQLDPGVISHGGLKQAGVVNAWRYVADKLGKNDPELSKEEYLEYIENHPFPKKLAIINSGVFIIANGSNARNAKKQDGEDKEIRTSGLLNVRAIVIDWDSFQDIYNSQNNHNLPTEYSKLAIKQELNSSWTPKHKGMHILLQQQFKNIQEEPTQEMLNIKQRINDIFNK